MSKYKPVATRNAHRRLAGTVSADDLNKVHEFGANAEPLLASVGRLTMMWNNIDFNLRVWLSSGGDVQEWMSPSTGSLIQKMRGLRIADELRPAWDHMLAYFDLLRLYRNHYTHGVGTTFTDEAAGVMEAYVIKTFHHPRYEEVIETIYKEDLDELTAHLFAFGGFSQQVLTYWRGYTTAIPTLPPLPPKYERQMRPCATSTE